jgi:hypothetical protein
MIEHASKDETRANLNQIAIWSDGSAAATDGHRLIMRRPNVGREAWDTDRGKPAALVSLVAAKQAAKLLRRPKDTVTVEDGTLRVGDVAIPFKSASDTFPPVHAVAREPKRTGHNRIGLAAPLLSSSTKVLGDLMRSRRLPALRIEFFGELDPVHLHCDGDDQNGYLVVLMQVRI